MIVLPGDLNLKRAKLGALRDTSTLHYGMCGAMRLFGQLRFTAEYINEILIYSLSLSEYISSLPRDTECP